MSASRQEEEEEEGDRLLSVGSPSNTSAQVW
jgi:hypothetical protein